MPSRFDALVRAFDTATRAGRRVDWPTVRRLMTAVVALGMRMREFWARLEPRERERLRTHIAATRREPRHLTRVTQKERDELIRIVRKGLGLGR